VIGGMWNQVDLPPEDNVGQSNDFRLIKSRSSHRLLFDDSDQTKVVLTDRKDQNLVACGVHAKGGNSDFNEYEVPSPAGINGQPKEGVSVAALAGTMNVWCPAGKLSISARNVEISAGTEGDWKASQIDMKGGRAVIKSAGGGKYQGAKIKLGG